MEESQPKTKKVNQDRNVKVEGVTSPARKKKPQSVELIECDKADADEAYADVQDDDKKKKHIQMLHRRINYSCICGSKKCLNLSRDWAIAFNDRPTRVMVSRHLYRKEVWRAFDLDMDKISNQGKVYIKLIHFSAQDRTTAWMQNEQADRQFRDANGDFILPKTSDGHWLEVEEEIRLLSLLEEMERGYYFHVKDRIFGKNGASVLSLEKLRLEKKQKLDKVVPKLQNLHLNPAEAIFFKAKTNGSSMTSNILQHIMTQRPQEKIVLPIKTIPSKLYLHNYIDAETTQHTVRTSLPMSVETLVPYSFLSRRKHARPACKKSDEAKDYPIVVHLDADLLIKTFLPCDEKGNASKKTPYNGAIEGIYNRKPFTAEKMSTGYNSHNQLIYIDSKNELKELMPRKMTCWNSAHYFRIGDVLDKAEIEACIELAKITRLDHTAVYLIMMCRAKGKLEKETAAYEKDKAKVLVLFDDGAVVEAMKKFETFMERLLEIVVNRMVELPASDLMRLTWVAWNAHLTKFENLFNDESKLARQLTREKSLDLDERNKLAHQFLMIMQHTQQIKDEGMLELHCRVGLNIPDNKVALKLFEQHRFYDLYWIVTGIFNGFGMESQRAEIHLSTIAVLELMFQGKVPLDHSLLSLYQCGQKKVNIVLNEMVRHSEENGSCVATGNDRHVIAVANWFNPYEDTFLYLFTMFLCHHSKDCIKWNYNEVIGELRQAMRASSGSNRKKFGVGCYVDLLSTYPGEYEDLIEFLCTPQHWSEVTDSLRERK